MKEQTISLQLACHRRPTSINNRRLSRDQIMEFFMRGTVMRHVMKLMVFVALVESGMAVNSYTLLNPQDFGAVGDGASHPLSNYYSTLAQAQVLYPHAVSLNDEIDWAAIQAAQNSVPNRGCRMSIPFGTYIINRTLKFFTEDVIEGNRATLKAGSNFSFPNNDTAMIVIENENGASLYAGSQHKRIFIRDLILDGNNVPGSNGFLASLQQQTYIRSFRVNRCKGYGVAVATAQQAIFKDLMILDCGRALVLRSARFVSFDGLNIEQSDTKDIVIENADGNPSQLNTFYNVHIEQDNSHTVFDCTNVLRNLFDRVFVTSAPTSTIFNFTTNPQTYHIRGAFVSGDATNVTMINDTFRGFNLNALSQFDSYITDWTATEEQDADWSSGLSVVSGNAGYGRLTAHDNGIEMELRARSSGQQRPLLRLRDTSGVEFLGVYKEGFFQFKEVSSVGNGPTNSARLFVRDNGSGKTELCVIFASGLIQILATEP